MAGASISPQLSTKIASLYDGVELECRVYHPRRFPSNRVAIFAHPYGPLGGSFDDTVVLTAVSELSSQGYIVGTFNFRGAGASGGRTSWTAKPELQDYHSFIGFMLSYTGFVLADFGTPNPGDGPEIQRSYPSKRITFLCGGYSYGAMITIQEPPVQDILGQFAAAPINSSEASIILRAQAAVSNSLSSGRNHLQGDKSTPECCNLSGNTQRYCAMPQLTVQRSFYLLVSPVLPPAAWAIALPVRPSSTRRAGNSGQDGTKEALPTDKLHQEPTCVIYGQSDQFTAVGKLRKWTAKRQSIAGSQVTTSEIAGVGHFWVSDAASNSLREAIRTWLLGLG